MTPEKPYSFYQLEYYRDYFDVVTPQIYARLIEASLKLIFFFIKSPSNLIFRLWPSERCAFHASRQAGAKGEFYGVIWVTVSMIFWCFICASIETNFLTPLPANGTPPISYDLGSLWWATFILFVMVFLWPSLAFFFKPTIEVVPNAEVMESQDGPPLSSTSWSLCMSIYAYTNAALVPYALAHMTLVILFGSWTFSWMASLTQWSLFACLALNNCLYLLCEYLPIYFPTLYYNAPCYSLLSQLKEFPFNLPSTWHFLMLLLIETFYLLIIALIFFRF